MIMRLDARDRIVDVNDAWLNFAVDNGAPALSREGVVGKSLWDLVTDLDMSHLYRLLFDRVRQRGSSVNFDFRCDAPAERRFLGLQINLLPDQGLEIRTAVDALETRPVVDLLSADSQRSGATLEICSWCKQVRVGESDWREVEAAAEVLGLLDASTLPRLAHVTCPDCYERVMAELD